MLTMTRLAANKFLLFIFFINPIFPQLTGDVKIGVIHSELTKQLLHKNDNNFYPIQDWELFFLNRKINYQVFTNDDLENSSFSDIDMLILPSIEILSDDGIESIKDFLDEGKSILILGNFGTRYESGRIRNPSALGQITNLDVKELPVENKNTCYQKIYADNFLGLSLEKTNDIQIINQFAPLYADEFSVDWQILGEYFLPDENIKEENIYPGIVFCERKNGSKILWFGFQLSQISAGENLESILGELFLNSISILANIPVAWINPYPSSFNTAVVLECDISKIDNFLSGFEKAVKGTNVRANFFITPAEISSSVEQLNILTAIGDLNVLFDGFEYLGKDQYFIDSLFKKSYQFLIGESRHAASDGIGVKFYNFYKYQIEKYLATDSRKYFNFYLTEDHSFKIIKNNMSDLDESENNFPFQSKEIVINLSELLEQDYTITSSLKEKFEQAEKSREVITLYFNSKSADSFNTKSESNLRKILDVVKENDCWITTYSELIRWFEERQNLKVEVESNSEEYLFTLKVSNSGKTLANNVGLVISVPSYYKNLRLISYNYKLEYNKKRGAYYLFLPFIKAGENILIDFECEGR